MEGVGMTTPLIPVVYKRSRVKYRHKHFGGVLNPHRAYYVYRMECDRNPMNKLQKVTADLKARAV
jgi:hypothetical protein